MAGNGLSFQTNRALIQLDKDIPPEPPVASVPEVGPHFGGNSAAEAKARALGITLQELRRQQEEQLRQLRQKQLMSVPPVQKLADGGEVSPMGDILSAAERMKRRAIDLVNNPIDYLQQTADHVKNTMQTPEGAKEMAYNGISGGLGGITKYEAYKAASEYAKSLKGKMRSALEEYTDTGSPLHAFNLNDVLRTGKPVPKDYLDHVKTLDEVIRKAPVTDTELKVYRGQPGDLKGKQPGYTSTSIEKDVADDYADSSEGSTFGVFLPKKTPLVNPDIKEFWTDHELLLPRNTSFSRGTNANNRIAHLPEEYGGIFAERSGYTKPVVTDPREIFFGLGERKKKEVLDKLKKDYGYETGTSFVPHFEQFLKDNGPKFAEGGLVAPVQRLAEGGSVSPLASILSGADTIKRRTKDMLSHPLAYLQQTADHVKNRLQTQEGAKEMALDGLAPGVGGIIKNKGGNWLTGSVEDALKNLKKLEQPRYTHMNEAGQAVAPEYGRPMTAAELAEVYGPANANGFFHRNKVLNNWIDGTLTKYIKRDMATEGDPVRKLAEQGILHYAPETFNPVSAIRRNGSARVSQGFPENGVGVSDLAKDWENVSDYIISPEKVKSHLSSRSPVSQESAPWLKKLNPEDTVFRHEPVHNDELGFSHITDELSNALNPESGLPRQLMLTPEQIQQMGMEKAVRHVHEINQWRASQKAEANAKLGAGGHPAVHQVREYAENNPKGLRWVELRAAGDRPAEGYTITPVEAKNGTYWKVEGPGFKYPSSANTEKEAIAQTHKLGLQEQLKYEGDTMGHCAGSYCDAVSSGETRIFSLRDANGEPHVTIETRPGYGVKDQGQGMEMSGNMDDLFTALNKKHGDDKVNEFTNTHYDENLGDGHLLSKFYEFDPEITSQFFPELTPKPASMDIIQIKGKQNKKPKDSYIPFVQDFVRNHPEGGQWGDIAELHNADLYNVGGKHLTKPDLYDIHKDINHKDWNTVNNLLQGEIDNGYAKGGLVAPVQKLADGGLIAREIARQRIIPRTDPMRDSVMSQKGELAWKPDYEREGGHALEAPMISPDDIIGTGLPTKAAAVAAKLAGGKTSMGALGMLIGMRGAETLGDTRIQNLLAKEMEASLKARRAGMDDRMKSNSGKELVHTGFDRRPFVEIGDEMLLPNRYQEFDKEVPLLDHWMIPERFKEAYRDRLENTKLVNSMQDPVNSGSYNSDTNVLMIGHRMPSNPVYKEFFEKYPVAHAQRVRQTMGHELTHLMQNEERAIGGTGPEYILRALNDTPEPELERHLTRGGFLQSVGAGDNPEKLFQMYVDAGTDKGTLRQLHNYMTALKDGRMSVEDAYEQGKFHESSASNVMKRLENKEKLVDLRKRRFLEQMPEEIQQSAHKYGVENQTGNNPFAVQRDAYGLYRANAGENQAESAGQRVGMSIKQRREEPFQFESGIPLDFLHNVR